MKIIIEQTSKIVELRTETGVVPARIWEGHTQSGIAVHCFVTCIAAPNDADLAQFEAELSEQRVPSVDVASYPARLLL